MDANGNLTDSGSKASDFATASQGANADNAILFVEQDKLTDQQRNTAIANVSNQTADPTTGKMGYKVLDSTKTFASQVTAENTIYEIRDVFDLGGSNVTIPDNTKFKFNGGIIKNGYLSGEFHSDNPVDVSSFGLVYNDSSAALQNANYFKILSNVTNKVNLVLSDELYIKSTYVDLAILQNYIDIDGCNNTIHIDNFRGFKAVKDVIIKNCKFVSETTSILLYYDNDLHGYSLIFENNSFEGDMRIVDCYTVSDENLISYFDEIKIYNNKFTDMHCSYGDNNIFDFCDSNYIELIVENNIVHNFYSQFIGCGISNNSVYSNYISNFYLKNGRNTIIKNNTVYNDIDYYPWTKYNATAYFTFALIEAGVCYYENNTIKNLIDKVRDGETSGDNTAYDAYLSVDILYSKNNNIKNCVKQGRACEFIKCKGTNSGIVNARYIENNIYELDDLLELDESLFSTSACLYTELNCDTIKIDNCKFNVATVWNVLTGQTNGIRKYLLSNSEFTLNNIVDNTNACILPCNSSKIEEVIIVNNKVLVTNNNPTFGLIGFGSPFAGRIICNNNIMQNCKLIGSDNILGLNLISNDNIVTSVNDKYLIDNIAASFYNNSEWISRNIYNIPSSMITNKPYTYRWFNEKENVIKIGDILSVKTIEFRLPDYDTSYINVQFIIEILNRGISFKGELNFSKINNVNTMYYIQYDKTVSAITDTSSHYLYNLNGNPTSGDSATNRAIRIINSSSRGYFYLNVYANDIVRITKVAKKVGSIDSLENNVIEDSGKFIMWNKTAWVNLDGTSLS